MHLMAGPLFGWLDFVKHYNLKGYSRSSEPKYTFLHSHTDVFAYSKKKPKQNKQTKYTSCGLFSDNVFSSSISLPPTFLR